MHNYFEVDINPHFANLARQTSTKFRLPKEISVEIGKKYGILSYEKNKELRLGIFGLTPEQRVENCKRLKELGIGFHSLPKENIIENAKKGGNISKELRLGIHALTLEQRVLNASKGGFIGGKKAYEMKLGIHGMSFEERSKRSIEIGLRHKENKTGVCGLSLDERSYYGKIGGKKAVETNKKNGTSFWNSNLQSNLGKKGGSKSGSKNAKKLNSQVWECTITGHRSNPGGLSKYQRARGIDTTKRVRIS